MSCRGREKKERVEERLIVKKKGSLSNDLENISPWLLSAEKCTTWSGKYGVRLSLPQLSLYPNDLYYLHPSPTASSPVEPFLKGWLRDQKELSVRSIQRREFLRWRKILETLSHISDFFFCWSSFSSDQIGLLIRPGSSSRLKPKGIRHGQRSTTIEEMRNWETRGDNLSFVNPITDDILPPLMLPTFSNYHYLQPE